VGILRCSKTSNTNYTGCCTAAVSVSTFLALLSSLSNTGAMWTSLKYGFNFSHTMILGLSSKAGCERCLLNVDGA